MNLKRWMSDPQNVYVGRRGRIFIDGDIFHYRESKWANPYTVKEYGLELCLELYSHSKGKDLVVFAIRVLGVM